MFAHQLCWLSLLLPSQVTGPAEPPAAEVRGALDDAAADTLVVCPEPFRDALQPWLAYRRGQGHRIAVIGNLGGAGRIRQQIRQQASGGRLKNVVLIGDTDTVASDSRLTIPTFQPAARVNVLFVQGEPTIASDLPYADLDGDGRPELTIGRLTADSPVELTLMVDKVLAYERGWESHRWQTQLEVVAGVGGFGGLIDGVLEATARRFLTDEVPATHRVCLTYGNWRSPFCPDPRRFHEATLETWQRGSLFWVYLGHGQRTLLDRVRVPGNSYHILGVDDADKLECRLGSPVAVFLACYTGAYDFPRDCLAERMLRARGGPVAVYSGSRVTMPYAMAVMGHALLEEYFQKRRETLGELVRQAKCSLLEPAGPDRSSGRRLLDGMAGLLSPKPSLLAEERAEHAAIFNLLGDPLLRLPHPRRIELDCPAQASASETITIRGRCDLAGRATVQLVARRDQLTAPFTPRRAFPDEQLQLQAYDAVYRQANDWQWATQEFACTGGQFELQLAIPAAAKGPCHVRVFVEDDGGCAVGSRDLQIKAASGPGPGGEIKAAHAP